MDGDPSAPQEITISESADVSMPEADVTAPETEAVEQESLPAEGAQEAQEAQEPAAPEPVAEEVPAEPPVVEAPAVEEPGDQVPAVEEQALQGKADLPVEQESAAEDAVVVEPPAQPVVTEQPPIDPQESAVESADSTVLARSVVVTPMVELVTNGVDASEAGVVPVAMDLNPSRACTTLGYEHGFKIAAGSLPYNGQLDGVTGSSLAVTLSDAELGEVVAWTSSVGIDAVVVKGSDLSNVYTYIPEGFSDAKLHAPTNTNNGKYPDVSNVSFCFDDEKVGYLKMAKEFDPLTSGFDGTFSVVYTCGTAGPVTVELAAGESTTVGPFPTGTVCTVTEPAVPTAPLGWTFSTPLITGSPGTIVKGDQAAAVLVTVTNSITRDQGYLKVTKAFDPLTSGFAGTFSVVYQCGTSAAVTVPLVAGASTTVGPFPTGTVATSANRRSPPPRLGGRSVPRLITGSPATIVKGNQAAAILVTVTNSITRDQGT